MDIEKCIDEIVKFAHKGNPAGTLLNEDPSVCDLLDNINPDYEKALTVYDRLGCQDEYGDLVFAFFTIADLGYLVGLASGLSLAGFTKKHIRAVVAVLAKEMQKQKRVFSEFRTKKKEDPSPEEGPNVVHLNRS